MRINSELANKFSASTVHLEHITTALSCLTPFGSKDDVLIFIDADGLSFVRENNHVIKSNYCYLGSYLCLIRIEMKLRIT